MPTVHYSATRRRLPLLAAGIALAFSLVACQPQSRAAGADAPAPATPATSTTPAPAPEAAPPPAPAATPAPAPATTPAPVATATSVVLSIGEETSIGSDTRLRLLRVVSDSRCPKGVQCVWAGEVTLEFELSARAGKKKFQLAQARSPSAAVGTLAFELKSYLACPPGSNRMADAECATVAITAAPTR